VAQIKKLLRTPWWPYVEVATLTFGSTLVGHVAIRHITPVNVVMIYLLVVVVTALRWGERPAVAASVLGVFALDFFLVEPRLSLTVEDAEYVVTFAVLLLVALVIGRLTAQQREHAAELKKREQETAALYAFSRSLVSARSLQDVADVVAEHAGAAVRRPVQLAYDGRAVGDGAAWSSPITTPAGAAGTLVVLGFRPLAKWQVRMMEAVSGQVAIVCERLQMSEAAHRARLLEEAERLQDALLHSISHALRTPLASIIGSLGIVGDPSQAGLDPAVRQDLLDTAREEAERLNWLVSNLLDMTRLESGHLTLSADWHDLEDVAGVALSQAAVFLRGRPVNGRLDRDLPLVRMDQTLILQVMGNLLDNAAKYSPAGSAVDLDVYRRGDMVEVRVGDRGRGVDPDDRERIFEKFYRGEGPGHPAGTGLGLAICKGIVEAHGGRIWVEPREGGGSSFVFTLPVGPEGEADYGRR